MSQFNCDLKYINNYTVSIYLFGFTGYKICQITWKITDNTHVKWAMFVLHYIANILLYPIGREHVTTDK